MYIAIVLLKSQFNKVLKGMDRKSRLNVKNISSDISKNSDSQRKARTKEKPNQGKGIQCHECVGFGHTRSKCPTCLKKQKKGLFVSSSDDFEGETDDETAKHVTAFTGRYDSEGETDDETAKHVIAFTGRYVIG